MKKSSILAALLFMLAVPLLAQTKTIAQEEIKDKITGYWVGQLVGNFMGFPFENKHVKNPIPVLIDHYYTAQEADSLQLPVNAKDARGYVPFVAGMFDGAWSDDDTDIEFVTLHAVEEYGLDITYPEITGAWKKHINRRIWVANRTARDLMEQGMVAPTTGSKENNENWYQIDPQLVNEIWSIFYPGMIRQATERAEWGARITNDDWGTHPTIAYGAMISAAFFESDVNTLVKLALDYIPKDSPFYEGMQDVIRWHRENDDWRQTRQLIHDKYYRYQKDDYEAPVSIVSSLNNGLCGIMAILYGEGDFLKTVSIATSAGYDCDNQAATCGALLGVINGLSGIPSALYLRVDPRQVWQKPFNNRYINYSRDELPINNKITDIVDRIAAIVEKAVINEGGRVVIIDGTSEYQIKTTR